MLATEHKEHNPRQGPITALKTQRAGMANDEEEHLFAPTVIWKGVNQH